MSADSAMRLGAAVLLLGLIACDTDLPDPDDPGAGQPLAAADTCGTPRRNAAATARQDAPDDCLDEDAGTIYSPTEPLGLAYPDFPRELPIPRTAYLTFDDGPSEWTNEFLDILKAHGVHATFFITAKQLKGEKGLRGSYIDGQGNLQTYQNLLKRIQDEGHVIGNHTVDHPDLLRLNDDQIEAELDQNEMEINQALIRAGARPVVLSLVRPPTGSPWFTGDTDTSTIIEDRRRVGQRISRHGVNVLWNVTSSDADDWAQDESYSRTLAHPPTESAPSFDVKVARIKNAVAAGPLAAKGSGILVLMHDTHSATLAALPSILDSLKAAGYSFATVEDLVKSVWGRGSIELTPGPHVYSHCMREREWGCLTSGAKNSQGEPLEVCGRMWGAYVALGGAARLGNPVDVPRMNGAGLWSQSFERGTVELHPENIAPCNSVFRGR